MNNKKIVSKSVAGVALFTSAILGITVAPSMNNTVYARSVARTISNTAEKSSNLKANVGDTTPTYTIKNGIMTLTGGTYSSGSGYYPWYGSSKIKEIDITGRLTLTGNAARYFFANLHSLVKIEGLSNIDVSNADNLDGMFADDTSLESLTLSFTTSHMTSMDSMFDGCSSLKVLQLFGFDNGLFVQGGGLTNTFRGLTSLTQLTIPRSLRLSYSSDTGLGSPAGSDNWQAVATGTVTDPAGATYTPVKLVSYYTGSDRIPYIETYVPEGGIKDQTAVNVDTTKEIDNGSTFDPKSVFHSITKADGTSVTDYDQAISSGMNVSGADFDTKDTGTHDVVFTYNGKSATCTVTVKAPVTDQTAIDVNDHKKINNGDKFDPSSIFNSITKPDGTKVTDYNTAKTDGLNVSGADFDTTVAGDYTVTFSYNGKTVASTITVLPATNDKTAIDVNSTKVINSGDTFTAQSVFNSITKPDGTKVTDFNTAKTDGLKVSGDNFNTSVAGTYSVEFTYNGKTARTTVTVLPVNDKTSLNVHDVTLNVGDHWDPALGFTSASDRNGNSVGIGQVSVTGTVNTAVPGNYTITYSYGGVTKGIDVYVRANNSANVTPSTPSTPNNPTTPSNPSTPNNTNSNPVLPNYASKKGAVVYGINNLYLYKNANFTKGQRITKYVKKPRIYRPMFVVTDYSRSTTGKLRYKVTDVDHPSKTGYITANWNYVRPVYYASKHSKITVISPKGVNGYKTEALTGKVKNYKQGTVLNVKGMVKHNLTTRYILSNGKYVTANRKLVNMGRHKTVKKVRAKTTINRYKDVNLSRRNQTYKKGKVFKVYNYDYSHGYNLQKHGALRYHVAGGYITGNSKYVKVIR